jgi:hypothetical protein
MGAIKGASRRSGVEIMGGWLLQPRLLCATEGAKSGCRHEKRWLPEQLVEQFAATRRSAALPSKSCYSTIAPRLAGPGNLRTLVKPL